MGYVKNQEEIVAREIGTMVFKGKYPDLRALEEYWEDNKVGCQSGHQGKVTREMRSTHPGKKVPARKKKLVLETLDVVESSLERRGLVVKDGRVVLGNEVVDPYKSKRVVDEDGNEVPYSKIVGTDFEREVITCLNSYMTDYSIARQVRKNFSVQLDPNTVKNYRTYHYATRKKELGQKQMLEGLAPQAATIVDYLEALVRFREMRVLDLVNWQTDKPSGGTEQLISNHLSCIQQLKVEQAKITGGIELSRIKVHIIKAIIKISTNSFYSYLPEDKRKKIIDTYINACEEEKIRLLEGKV